jgi:hypothetical protein
VTSEDILDTIKKSLIKALINNLWPLLISAIPTISAYFYLRAAKVFDDPLYVKYMPVALAILLGTSILFLIKWLRIHLRYERFHHAYGVLWDKELKMHCIQCHKLLKYSSHDPSVHYCSDPKCNNKHTLKGIDGDKITEQQAIELIRNS